MSSCPMTGCAGGAAVELGSGGGPIAIDADAEYIYVGRVGTMLVQRCPLTGCVSNETNLITGIRPISVAVDTASIYISDYDVFQWGGVDASTAARILRCPLAGCGASGPTEIASGDISPYAIAVDATRIYFTNHVQGTIVSIPK